MRVKCSGGQLQFRGFVPHFSCWQCLGKSSGRCSCEFRWQLLHRLLDLRRGSKSILRGWIWFLATARSQSEHSRVNVLKDQESEGKGVKCSPWKRQSRDLGRSRKATKSPKNMVRINFFKLWILSKGLQQSRGVYSRKIAKCW